MKPTRLLTQLSTRTKLYVRPRLIMTTPTALSAPSPTRSPPHKRAKIMPGAEAAPAATAGPGPSTTAASKSSTEVLEAPVRAMFAPNMTKAEMRRKQRKMKHPIPEPYSSGDVLWHDVRDFLGHEWVDGLISKDTEEEWTPPSGLEKGTEIELRVGAFTVSGESLSLYQAPGSDKKWAVLAPFAHPGDLIRCRIFKHDRLHSSADLLEILEYDETHRGGEGDRRKFPGNGCKYFGKCGGCQLQPVPYPQQLLHKRKTVELAYQRFSRLASDQVPEIQPTIPSPKQWGYRTKITPHFDAAPRWLRDAVDSSTSKSAVEEEEGVNGETKRVNGDKGVWKVMVDEAEVRERGKKGGKKVPFGLKAPVEAEKEAQGNEDNGINGINGENGHQEVKKKERTWELRIGFEGKGMGGVMDIEDCPIATPILNAKMTEERRRTQDSILSFQRGATLLLRDSLPTPDSASITPFDPSTPIISEESHVAITNHRLPVYERVGDKLFTFTAGSFFQNNNSILVPLTEYVREAVFPPGIPDEKKPTHLVDTYCGSGLFGITLSGGFQKVAGVEIDPQSVEAAKKNAEINDLQGRSTWLCGKAEDIFGDLPKAGFAGGHSCVVVDPPRKGCDEPFLEQLLAFKPLTIVYVSCNVHTQARDVGWFLQVGQARGIKYTLESLRGFDLFPQTAHVESVAVLRLAE